MGDERRSRWNHNIQYHGVILREVPAGARSALDAGTGDGMLAAELRASIPDVVAIDLDESVLARAAVEHPGIHWVHGDVMTHAFGRRFDVVASVAVVHHLPDLPAALRRLASLTAPGGVLVVIGLARSSTLRDHLFSLVGVVQHRRLSRTRGLWAHTAPTAWPPPHTYGEVRRIAARTLPDVQWRRFPLWRYALIWRRPVVASDAPAP